MSVDGAVERVTATAYRVPTDAPGPGHEESDGTLSWASTDIAVVEVAAAGCTGLGYTYAHPAAVSVIEDKLAGIVVGCRPDAHLDIWKQLRRSVRNIGCTGLVAMAISALDAALWDLEARLE